MNEKPDDFKYPEGTYVVATGSPLSGFKLWGTFVTVEAAVGWAEKQPLLGPAAVMPVQLIENCKECENTTKQDS